MATNIVSLTSNGNFKFIIKSADKSLVYTLCQINDLKKKMK